jgi:hypothetical protein
LIWAWEVEIPASSNTAVIMQIRPYRSVTSRFLILSVSNLSNCVTRIK